MKKMTALTILVLAGVLVWFGFFRQPKITPAPVEKPTEKIVYTNASADLIVVDLPFPGAVTGKDFSVIGRARGYWFFEASFPIDVLDQDGEILAQTYATAQSEWMTEEFVPFKSQVIKVPDTYIGPATLVLRKDNASGLPEHDASIAFPITIEY